MKKKLNIQEYVNSAYIENIRTVLTNKNNKKGNICVELDIQKINCANLFDNNFTNIQLKKIAKHYDLVSIGNKQTIILQIYTFLNLYNIVTKIQCMFRGCLQRKYNKLRGPAIQNRLLCTNDTDFLSGDELKNINFVQFFSYKDEDGFIYGFDIISLYNLIIKSDKIVKNPYNRKPISDITIKNITNLLQISKILNISIDTNIKEINVSEKKTTELRILDLFQNIDALGNYSNPIWFSSLNRFQLIKFLRELIDIWSYRAQLTIEVKRAICPPNGDPFRNINYYEQDLENIKNNILTILEKFVCSGIDKDSKSLGAYYVLGALTIVNEDAALALPWLYQSVSHF